MESRGKRSGRFEPRGSGRFEPRDDTRAGRLMDVLVQYVARLSAAAVLKGSMARLGYVDAELTPEQLERLVAEVMIGLRLFCDPARLPELMVDLAELCERERER